MSQPDDRSATGTGGTAPGNPAHGSTAFTGTPLPGQPLADQPTEVVQRPDGEWQDRQDTAVVAPVPAYAPPLGPTDGGAWRDDRYDDRYDSRDDDRYDGRDGGRHAHPDDDATAPEYRDAPVVVRRADSVAGLLLLLAGIAAGVSLLLVWVNGGGTGLELVRDGFDDLRTSPRELVDRDSWEPPAVVLGGGVLFVLGLLLFVPARTHRFLGVLALLVTLVVAAGVLVPLADAGWDLDPWAVGAWFAVAVGALGFLGALKALMTGEKRR